MTKTLSDYLEAMLYGFFEDPDNKNIAIKYNDGLQRLSEATDNSLDFSDIKNKILGLLTLIKHFDYQLNKSQKLTEQLKDGKQEAIFNSIFDVLFKQNPSAKKDFDALMESCETDNAKIIEDFFYSTKISEFDKKLLCCASQIRIYDNLITQLLSASLAGQDTLPGCNLQEDDDLFSDKKPKKNTIH